jgi:methyl-accepting chemotaxis protein
VHMRTRSLPTKREFWRSIFILQTWTNVVAAVFIIAYLWPALSFTADQIVGIMGVLAVLVAVLMPPYGVMFYRWYAPILEYLASPAPEEVPREVRLAAFGVVTDLPRRQFFGAFALWLLFGFPGSLYMYLTFDDFSLDSMVVLFTAIASGGLISSVIGFFVMKNHLEEIRTALSRGLPEPALRRGVVRPVSVRAKLFVSTSGLILVTLIFGVSVTNVRGKLVIERFVTETQEEILDHVLAALDGGAPLERAIEAARGSPRGVVQEFAVVDLERARAGTLDAPPLVAAEIRAILEQPSGRSTRVDTPNGFAWKPLPGDTGQVLVAIKPLEALGGGFFESQKAFLALIAVAFVAAVATARFVSGDFGSAIDALRSEVRRIAEGDLRIEPTYESEDDLGDLARSVEEMAFSLRETVAQVAGAASRVEDTAREIEKASSGVNRVAGAQSQSIQRVSQEMDQVSLRAREISTSASSLASSVEDSSSAILQLKTVGEELHEFTADLAQRVDATAGSVEAMSGSIGQVAQNTHQLSEVAAGAVARTREMAAESRTVEKSADETETLYEGVIETAERGSQRVTDTIGGMRSTRETVEDARRVVRGLASRTEDIGSIVTVIDDIADRTSLLALNAAIIAAQAGEHGRAFSVVATEIKTLADQVRAKTQEIGEVVSAVTEEAAQAVDLIERGTTSAERGVTLSSEAGNALEAITTAIRASGERIHEIVGAVHEQALGAEEVASLMDRLNVDLGGIRDASDEEARESERVQGISSAIQEIAKSVHRGAEEQVSNASHIASGIDTVSASTSQINAALGAQSGACDQVVSFLEHMLGRNRETESSVEHLDRTMRELLAEAEDLRAAVERFVLEDESS